MKNGIPVVNAIQFVPSEKVAQRLRDFSQVAGVSPEKLINDILEEELAAEPVEHGCVDPAHLARCLNRQQYSLEEAKTAAAKYNTFVLREAQRTGRPATNAAIVRCDADQRGFFRLWFPLLESRVQKIASQARQALQAAAA